MLLPACPAAEAVLVFHAAGLEPKRLRMVQASQDRPPYLFLMECRRGGKSGLQVEPALILRAGNGEESPELRRIYGDYMKGRP